MPGIKRSVLKKSFLGLLADGPTTKLTHLTAYELELFKQFLREYRVLGAWNEALDRESARRSALPPPSHRPPRRVKTPRQANSPAIKEDFARLLAEGPSADLSHLPTRRLTYFRRAVWAAGAYDSWRETFRKLASK